MASAAGFALFARTIDRLIPNEHFPFASETGSRKTTRRSKIVELPGPDLLVRKESVDKDLVDFAVRMRIKNSVDSRFFSAIYEDNALRLSLIESQDLEQVIHRLSSIDKSS